MLDFTDISIKDLEEVRNPKAQSKYPKSGDCRHNLHTIKPTVERVRQLFDYNKDTGICSWKKTSGKRRIGAVAGYIDAATGRRRMAIDSRVYTVSNLIWLHVYGEWPKKTIDHINRVRDDNRLVNLRLATANEQQYNSGLQLNNTSGYKGVSFNKRRAAGGLSPWETYITVVSRRKHLGFYWSKELAIRTRKEAELEYHGEFIADSLNLKIDSQLLEIAL